jgi:hypothetical protein
MKKKNLILAKAHYISTNFIPTTKSIGNEKTTPLLNPI